MNHQSTETIIYKEESYQIIGAAMEVHKILGRKTTSHRVIKALSNSIICEQNGE